VLLCVCVFVFCVRVVFLIGGFSMVWCSRVGLVYCVLGFGVRVVLVYWGGTPKG